MNVSSMLITFGFTTLSDTFKLSWNCWMYYGFRLLLLSLAYDVLWIWYMYDRFCHISVFVFKILSNGLHRGSKRLIFRLFNPKLTDCLSICLSVVIRLRLTLSISLNLSRLATVCLGLTQSVPDAIWYNSLRSLRKPTHDPVASDSTPS